MVSKRYDESKDCTYITVIGRVIGSDKGLVDTRFRFNKTHHIHDQKITVYCLTVSVL